MCFVSCFLASSPAFEAIVCVHDNIYRSIYLSALLILQSPCLPLQHPHSAANFLVWIRGCGGGFDRFLKIFWLRPAHSVWSGCECVDDQDRNQGQL